MYLKVTKPTAMSYYQLYWHIKRSFMVVPQTHNFYWGTFQYGTQEYPKLFQFFSELEYKIFWIQMYYFTSRFSRYFQLFNLLQKCWYSFKDTFQNLPCSLVLAQIPIINSYFAPLSNYIVETGFPPQIFLWI